MRDAEMREVFAPEALGKVAVIIEAGRRQTLAPGRLAGAGSKPLGTSRP